MSSKVAISQMLSLFVNPANTTNERYSRLLQWLAENRIEFRIMDDDVKTNGDRIHDACDGSDRIVIFGGDGTINIVVNLTHDMNIPYGIIPCGTGNDIAMALGLHNLGDEDLFTIATKGNIRYMDTWLVNGTHIMLSSVTFGFPVLINRIHAYKDKAEFDRLSRKLAIKSKCKRYVVECREGSLDSPMMILSLHNTRTIGGGKPMAGEDCRVDDGLIDVVCVRKCNIIRKMLNLISLSGKGPKGQRNVIVFRTDKVTVRCFGDEHCMIDGEEFVFDELEIVQGKKVGFAFGPE